MALNKLETSLYYNNSLHIYYIQIGSILFLFPFLFPHTFKWFDNLTNTLKQQYAISTCKLQQLSAHFSVSRHFKARKTVSKYVNWVRKLNKIEINNLRRGDEVTKSK